MGILKALAESARRFPNCRIANCGCDSWNGKWEAGCRCMCHFDAMNKAFGKDDWTLADFSASADRGVAQKAK